MSAPGDGSAAVCPTCSKRDNSVCSDAFHLSAAVPPEPRRWEALDEFRDWPSLPRVEYHASFDKRPTGSITVDGEKAYEGEWNPALRRLVMGMTEAHLAFVALRIVLNRHVTVEEVGPVSGAQETLAAGLRGLAAMVDDYFRGKYEDEPPETDPACHLWNAANAVMEDPGAIQTWLYAEHKPLDDDDAERALIAAGAVLSAAREVKSGRDLLRDTELLVVRADIQSVIDRMKLDVKRPELRCPARDEDYRATLERAVARLDGEVKSDGD